jgi:hypothetical protein
MGRAGRVIWATARQRSDSGALGGWIAPECKNVEYYGFGPCSEEVQEWLKDRNIYQDVYEELIAAYAFGAGGYRVFLYNYASAYGVAMVETVIFRVQAVDADGKRSIYAANMIYCN